MAVATDIHKQVQDSLREFFDGFKCQRCGACCQGSREVPLLVHEAKRLKRVKPHFMRHTYMRNGWTFLKMPCVFYSKFWKRCRIHQQRPIACKLYPTEVQLDGSLFIHDSCPGH